MSGVIEKYVTEIERVILKNEFELRNPEFREEFLKSLNELSPKLKNVFEAAINHKIENVTLLSHI